MHNTFYYEKYKIFRLIHFMCLVSKLKVGITTDYEY